MDTIKKLGLTVRNRVVGLDIRKVDTTKYELLKSIIWQFLTKMEVAEIYPSDTELFYNQLVFWRNEVVNDKHWLYGNYQIGTDEQAAYVRLEFAIEELMEELEYHFAP